MLVDKVRWRVLGTTTCLSDGVDKTNLRHVSRAITVSRTVLLAPASLDTRCANVARQRNKSHTTGRHVSTGGSLAKLPLAGPSLAKYTEPFTPSILIKSAVGSFFPNLCRALFAHKTNVSCRFAGRVWGGMRINTTSRLRWIGGNSQHRFAAMLPVMVGNLIWDFGLTPTGAYKGLLLMRHARAAALWLYFRQMRSKENTFYSTQQQLGGRLVWPSWGSQECGCLPPCTENNNYI